MKNHQLPLLALFASVCLGSFAQADATLTHRYDFNGNVLDAVGSIDGTLSPVGANSVAPAFQSAAPAGAVGPGQALQVGQTPGTRSGFTLDAAAYAAAGSISLWLRHDAAASTNSQADYVFNQGGTWNVGLRLFVRDNNTNQLRFAVGDTNVGTYSAGLTQDVWYHVAVTWDAAATSAAFYVNGTLVGGSTSIGATKFANTQLSFGNWSFPAATSTNFFENQFHGALYDLRVYDGLLTAGQIADLAANPGTAIPEPSSFAALAGALALGAVGARRRRRVPAAPRA